MAVTMANIQISVGQFFALFAPMSINTKTIMGIASQSRVSFPGFLGQATESKKLTNTVQYCSFLVLK
jgi:hypothetical protein